MSVAHVTPDSFAPEAVEKYAHGRTVASRSCVKPKFVANAGPCDRGICCVAYMSFSRALLFKNVCVVWLRAAIAFSGNRFYLVKTKKYKSAMGLIVLEKIPPAVRGAIFTLAFVSITTILARSTASDKIELTKSRNHSSHVEKILQQAIALHRESQKNASDVSGLIQNVYASAYWNVGTLFVDGKDITDKFKVNPDEVQRELQHMQTHIVKNLAISATNGDPHAMYIGDLR